jgi:hypothetical protein
MSAIYQQLEKRVKPHLRLYIEDLTKHDYKTLVTDNFKGQFLYAYRATGTHIVTLPESIKETFRGRIIEEMENTNISNACDIIRQHLGAQIVYINYTGFDTIERLFFNGSDLITITSKQAEDILTSHIEKLCSRLRSLNVDRQTWQKLNLF